ncbi:MAG: ATP-grasp domain-containing protein, partial [Gammaproteobacteria bacterium]|nr:ATP-grasp domain-containing protein [Gammaproteobacteria bacterium]
MVKHGLLLLIPNGSYRTRDFITAAKRFDVSATVGSNHKPVLQKRTPNQTLYVDFSNEHDAVKQIIEFNQADVIQAIIGVDEITTFIAAKASAHIGLKHNPPRAVSIAHDKYKMRCVLRDVGLNNPDFHLVTKDADIKAVAQNQSYPCVLKPTNLSASRGVIRANTAQSFIEAINYVRQISEKWHGTNDQPVLVESYIPGPEVALEGLLENGELRCLALFDKPGMSDGPYFEESMFITPSRLDQSVQDECVNTVQRATNTIGLCEGPVHAELRVNEDGPWLIELAARSIGGLCSRSLQFAGDVTLEEITVRHALDLPVEAIQRESSASGVMMIPIPARGRLLGVSRVDQARKVEGIKDIRMG